MLVNPALPKTGLGLGQQQLPDPAAVGQLRGDLLQDYLWTGCSGPSSSELLRCCLLRFGADCTGGLDCLLRCLLPAGLPAGAVPKAGLPELLPSTIRQLLQHLLRRQGSGPIPAGTCCRTICGQSADTSRNTNRTVRPELQSWSLVAHRFRTVIIGPPLASLHGLHTPFADGML